MSCKDLVTTLDRVQEIVHDRNSGFDVKYEYRGGPEFHSLFLCLVTEVDDGHLFVSGQGCTADEAAVDAIKEIPGTLIEWGWEDALEAGSND